jgi:hypothetical protein
MMRITHAVTTIGFLAFVSPAFAIYQEPKIPTTDHSDPIPGNSVKLDQDDHPSTEKKTPQKQVKPREREVPRQAERKSATDDQTDRGMSPDANRALGTAIGIGIGVGGGFGMGRRGGDDHGMSGRMDR